nr:MAG TPA: hypothetical protein [Caudoviricetes sp.]
MKKPPPFWGAVQERTCSRCISIRSLKEKGIFQDTDTVH